MKHRRQVGERHLRLVKSDGPFRSIAERNAAVERKRQRYRNGKAVGVDLCTGVAEIKATPSGAELKPDFWIPLRCCQARGHVGYCCDELGIGFVRGEGLITWWNKYTDADIYDLAMAVAEGMRE